MLAMRMIKNILSLIRYWDWQDKVRSLAVASIIYLIALDKLWSYADTLLILTIFSYIPHSYAYMLNSYTDRKEDVKVGKIYSMGVSRSAEIVIIIILGVLSLITLPIIFRDILVTITMIIIFLLSTFYSIRPVRLKEKGLVGLLVATIAQRLPFLFLLILIPDSWQFWMYLFGWLIIWGFLMEAGHQLIDFQNDCETNVRTFAIDIGAQRTVRMINTATYVLMIYIALPIVYVGFQCMSGVLLAVVLFLFSHDTLYYAHIGTEIHRND